MNKKDIVVVVPIYLSSISDLERKSLEQCLRLLSEYKIVVIKPLNLDINELIKHYNLNNIEAFPDECFSSLRAYNKLVLTEEFYKRFQCYAYMLIYQLDAYVFKDELLGWANRGYDYIGAPWLPIKRRYLSTIGRWRLLSQRWFYSVFKKELLKCDKFYAYQVGNGGLSLRRISKMIDVTAYYKDKIRQLLTDDKELYPEDVLLMLELSDTKCNLKKPSFKEALAFSMEENPQWAYLYNNKQLPFGCHAWYHKEHYSFWNQIIGDKY